jgi:uncharacterized protein (TIGR02594 family)
MNKLVIAVVVAFGVFGAPAIVHAKPTSTQQTVVKQPVKKKVVVNKRKKKPVVHAKVAPEHNPFLKNNSVFSSSHEQSSSEYWAQERAREQILAKNVEPPVRTKVALSRDQKRREIVKHCVWFICTETEVTKEVVAEAKKWEGKHAKKDKQELKKLFVETGQGPVDPVHIPWCAAFANAILRRTDVEGTDSLRARSFLTWGIKTKDPKEGDVVVLARGNDGWSGHVGFFMGYEWYEGVKYVKVLGGNTDKSVQVGLYPASKVIGYRTYA